jgi:hypothetical protein|tara:strand:- start:258 stop:1046 length:789 start_codon:yes stop_codon:yes gene_type:complete
MLDEDTLAVAGELNKPTIRISLNGKKFRKMVGAEEVATVNDSFLNVVIVKMSHTASRTYYEAAYQAGQITSPTCWSNDSKIANKEVPVAQAKSCYQCKNSVRGSGQNGVGTACKLSWRIAVVLANDIAGDILQLVLPAMSCFGKESNGRYPFRPYIQMLANNNVSAGRVVTRLQFDDSTSIPKLLFSPSSAVEEEDIEVLKKQATTREAESATILKVNQYQTDKDRPTVQFDVFFETPYEPTDADIEREENISNIVGKWKAK